MSRGISGEKSPLANHTSKLFKTLFTLSELIISVISHKYQQLPLITVEEFLEQHPEYEFADESALMTARISHEHDEREKLEQARQELLKIKQGLIADNKKRKDDLASLDKDLEKFIDVCPLSY